MKALSIKQPWAWLICSGRKDIENRSWRIGRKPAPGFGRMHYGLDFPCRIYVHAGKSPASNDVWDEIEARFGIRCPEVLPLGALIGEVDIMDCVKESKSPWFVGPYGFVLAHPALYGRVIPWSGQLGFFEVRLPTEVQP